MSYATRLPRDTMPLDGFWYNKYPPPNQRKYQPDPIEDSNHLLESFAVNLKSAKVDYDVHVHSGNIAYVSMKDCTEYIGSVFFNDEENKVEIRRLNGHNVIVNKDDISRCGAVVKMKWYKPDDSIDD